ncbi:MAG: phosphotransferase [Ktedonobacteraceae bacterium]|nr:phosphotransferase [Ktedonobacteraceae bacterium]
MNRDSLWTMWPVAGPWRIFPLVGGTNSLIEGIEATDGQMFVLRIVPDTTQAPRLQYEAALLEALHNQGLPFLFPIPLKAKSGDNVVSFTQEDGTTALATLCPLLPGRLTDRDDRTVRMTTSAGSALAVLDRAFASLPEIQTPDIFRPLPTFGDLAHWHPLVPDPLVAIERLPIANELIRQIQTFLSEVMESVPDLYKYLPQQLLHRDYDSSNILMDRERVTAILDFEFAGRDIRILDLCVSISWLPVILFGTGREWEVIDAFGKHILLTILLEKTSYAQYPLYCAYGTPLR